MPAGAGKRYVALPDPMAEGTSRLTILLVGQYEEILFQQFQISARNVPNSPVVNAAPVFCRRNDMPVRSHLSGFFHQFVYPIPKVLDDNGLVVATPRHVHTERCEFFDGRLRSDLETFDGIGNPFCRDYLPFVIHKTRLEIAIKEL